MRIAVVSFYFGKQEVGGAQMPALAFREWYRVFSPLTRVDLVGFYELFPPETLHSDVIWMPRKNFHRLAESYDFVFFVTPGRIISPEEWQKYDGRFGFMIHSETDVDLYGEDRVESMYENPNCEFVAVIGNDYWRRFPRKPNLKWHPCTLPDFLVKHNHEFPTNRATGPGILYMARLSKWKNAHRLAENSSDLIRLISYITVYGHFNEETYREKVMSKRPRWTLIEGVFDDSIEFRQKAHRNHSYFWDVSGSEQYNIKIKRLNLAAVEAMYSGCIPIVDFKTAPDWVQTFAIDVNHLWDLGNNDFKARQETMLEEMKRSDISYNAVAQQFNRIFRIINMGKGA